MRSQLEEMLWPSRWWSDGMGARGASNGDYGRIDGQVALYTWSQTTFQAL